MLKRPAGFSEPPSKQGHAGGQFWLGGLYRDGYGIPQDLVSAHMWLDLASRSTGRIHEVAVEHRAAVAALMTREELTAARRRAREWKPVNCTPVQPENAREHGAKTAQRAGRRGP